jgi:hypothetical protein
MDRRRAAERMSFFMVLAYLNVSYLAYIHRRCSEKRTNLAR